MPLIFQHKLSAYSTTSVQDGGRESYSVHLFLVICIRIYNFFLVTRRVTLPIYAFLSHIESSLTITNKGLYLYQQHLYNLVYFFHVTRRVTMTTSNSTIVCRTHNDPFVDHHIYTTVHTLFPDTRRVKDSQSFVSLKIMCSVVHQVSSCVLLPFGLQWKTRSSQPV
jgi:hypothetical protein